MSGTAYPLQIPVLIAGGGPVGLTLAALLARQGIASLLIEADDSFCSGSRAICISRRSQEILGWAGAAEAVSAKGLPWTGGRSYWRDTQVLHFQMPSEPTQRFAPMVNIQQFYLEQFVDRAMRTSPPLSDVRWSTRVESVRAGPGGVDVTVRTAAGIRAVHCDYLVACDGARSTVRDQLGLQLEGTQYEGRYVIVDIEQKTQRPVERLAWFDPPSNPGSTLLMHRQPDDVWRIDYQIRDDEDASEAVKPENVLPRVQSHLTMIGEHAPWKPLWISIYNAKCLTLRKYRHGRVFFAGDAAHLVPIFGVRGLNSGLDDAGNLAWKLAAVLRGEAKDTLLDSYCVERVHAARENILYGARTTEFMAPPNFAFRLLREATLRLAVHDEKVRSLINPRQSVPVSYSASPLTIHEEGEWSSDSASPGQPAPEALLLGSSGPFHLTQTFGKDFVCLVFSDGAIPAAIAALTNAGIGVLHLEVDADTHRQARERYGFAAPGSEGIVLVRPDGYVMGRWKGLDPAALLAELGSRGITP